MKGLNGGLGDFDHQVDDFLIFELMVDGSWLMNRIGTAGFSEKQETVGHQSVFREARDSKSTVGHLKLVCSIPMNCVFPFVLGICCY